MLEGPLDMEVVQELLDLGDGGDPGLLVDLIRMFLEDGPTKLQTILDGLTEGDLDKVERAAHSLKEFSGILGAVDLQDSAEIFQIASRVEAPDRLQDSVGTLSANFASAENSLRDLLEQHC